MGELQWRHFNLKTKKFINLITSQYLFLKAQLEFALKLKKYWCDLPKSWNGWTYKHKFK
jgi:hypothetical protein